MTARSAIRTRFFDRIGITNPSTEQINRANECLNAAVSRALSDGAPGIALTNLSAVTYGDLTVAGTATHSAGASTITFGTETFFTKNVFPDDILEINSQYYTVYDVTSTTVLDLGVPVPISLDGLSATIHRRSVILPSAGQVARVLSHGTSAQSKGGNRLTYVPYPDTYAAHYVTGDPTAYRQRYVRINSTMRTLLQVWPVPTGNLHLSIGMTKVFEQLDDDADVAIFPESGLDALLSIMFELWLAWTENQSQTVQVGAVRARIDSEDEIRRAASPTEPIKRF